MLELIVLIIFCLGFFGVAICIYRKIPLLANYVPSSSKNSGIIADFKEKFKNKIAFKTINSGETILLKTLSKSRVLTLKAEHKIGFWLNHLRQKSIEKEKEFKENYWEKINVKKQAKKAKERKSGKDMPR